MPNSLAVVAQRVDLLLRDRVGDRQAAVGRRHVVVGRGDASAPAAAPCGRRAAGPRTPAGWSLRAPGAGRCTESSASPARRERRGCPRSSGTWFWRCGGGAAGHGGANARQHAAMRKKRRAIRVQFSIYQFLVGRSEDGSHGQAPRFDWIPQARDLSKRGPCSTIWFSIREHISRRLEKRFDAARRTGEDWRCCCSRSWLGM